MILTYLILIITETISLKNIYIVFISFIAFVIGYLLIKYTISLKRIFLSVKQKNNIVEKRAKIIMNKYSKLYKSDTMKILIYISIFEQKTVILANKDLKLAIPNDIWRKIELNFQEIFKAKDSAISLLEQLYYSKQIFQKYKLAYIN